MSKPILPPLNQSIAKLLLQCPSKAWLHHPDLGGQDTGDTTAMADGRLFEALICGAVLDGFAVLDFDSYRTKAAQEARDAAISAGMTPVLAHALESKQTAAETIAAKIDRQLALNGLPTLNQYTQQPYMEWTCAETGAPCKGTPDLVHGNVIVDLKKAASAHPDELGRTVFRYGLDIQQAAYTEAVETLNPEHAGRVRFYFVAYEIDAPYCVTIYSLNGEFRAMGHERWNRAKAKWMRCLKHNDWHDYSADGVVEIEPKPWMMVEGFEA